MIVTVFRARMRDGADLPAMEPLGMRMHELASAMPGFVSCKDFASADGESLTLVEFASEAELLAWRHHPEHVLVQERGQREFFSGYQIQVCRVERAYGFDEVSGRSEAR